MGRYLNLAKKAIADVGKNISPESKQERPPWPVRCSVCGEVLPGLVEGVEHVRFAHPTPAKWSQLTLGHSGEGLAMNVFHDAQTSEKKPKDHL